MTKETILATKNWSTEYPNHMAEWAKHQAIAFDEWRIENRWFSFERGHYFYTFEHGTSMSEAAYLKNYVKTRDELYSQFIEQQTKDK